VQRELLLRFRYFMWKEGFVELMNLLKWHVRVGVKVNETVRGLHSTHEILIQQMEIGKKINYEK